MAIHSAAAEHGRLIKKRKKHYTNSATLKHIKVIRSNTEIAITAPLIV